MYLDVLHFVGVNASGDTYVNLGEKPAAQIVTNMLDVDITGSINAPIAGNTNWLDNGLTVAPLDPLDPVWVSVSATGGGFQAINLGVTGNMVADSGTTTTPFIGVPLTTGGFPAGGLQGNVGSSMILQATGSLTLVGMPTGSPFAPPLAFQFPGGLAFKAGTTLMTTDAGVQRVDDGGDSVPGPVVRGADDPDRQFPGDQREHLDQLQHGAGVGLPDDLPDPGDQPEQLWVCAGAGGGAQEHLLGGDHGRTDLHDRWCDDVHGLPVTSSPIPGYGGGAFGRPSFMVRHPLWVRATSRLRRRDLPIRSGAPALDRRGERSSP